MHVIEYILENDTLSKSQYNAIITLLYKKGNREDISNWRPISLLNTDYKIITKLLAERLKLFLPKLVHSDQKGFISGRNISDANRLVQDIIEYSDRNQLNSAVIFLDYKKAFDRVEWEWTIRCLQKFNFCQKFQSWIKMIFKHAKASILTNGFRSKYFMISRSMRQGCPISPLLYILQAEPLACAIRKNRNIIGITLPYSDPGTGKQAEVKLVSYVDDTQFFSSTEESIVETFKTANKFEKASGAKINKTKTVGLYLGAWRNKIPLFKEITWTKTNVKTLGINHGYEVDENEIWMEKVNKIKSCIQIWKSRNLSYVGKVLIIKTLLASQIGFLADIKPVPNNVIKLIESLMWNFLWNNKQPLVYRKTMYLKQSEGGVKMLNLREFIESKQINFMYKIIKSEYEHWNIIGKGWLKTFDTDYNIYYFVCKCTSVKGLCLKEIPKYYQDCISAWTKLNGILMQKTKENILNSSLFGNKYITLRSSPIFISSFSKSNIKTVKQIWNSEANAFHEPELIRDRLLDKTGWNVKYKKIKSSFPPELIEILKCPNVPSENAKQITMDNELNIFFNNKHLKPQKFKLKLIQNILLDTDFERKYMIKWETLFNEHFQWKQIWTSTLELPLSNTEKQFQWKVVHNAIFTEHKLFLMNMSNGLCHFCKANTETLTHLFYDCAVVNRIIREIEAKINCILEAVSQLKINLLSSHLVLGFLHENSHIRKFVNFIIILMKWEIWKLRNKVKYDNRQFSFQQILDCILQKVHTAVSFLGNTSAIKKYKKELALWNKI